MTPTRPQPVRIETDVVAMLPGKTISVLGRIGRVGAACVFANLLLAYSSGTGVAWAAKAPTAAAMEQVGATCREEASRLCSWIEPVTVDPGTADPDAAGKLDSREVFICLRMQTTDVSPVCRKAINAAKQ